MEARRIEVLRYYAFNGKEFDDSDKCEAYESDKCEAYEREKRVEFECKISENRTVITTLKNKANESRLRFRLAQCDADDALNSGDIITFHKKMVEFYEGKDAYNEIIADLHYERQYLNNLIDKSYSWFGNMKRKSSIAKRQRVQKSLRWRQENTPDKWRTPNKIRVNKTTKGGE